MMNNSLLASFSPEKRRNLLRSFTAQEVPPGTVLFEEGEPSRGIYVMVRGEAMVSRGRYGTRRRVTRVRAGSTLGVGSAVSGEAAQATVTTAAPSTLLFMPTHRLWPLLADAPAASATMGALAAQRRAD
jgi:CRP-like cAMP-binding protein